MRQRDFYMLGLGFGSLLFSILTLVAGCRKGTLNDYAIAAVYQPPFITEFEKG
jgi:hypothetical protein